jgi:hypothetical protein
MAAVDASTSDPLSKSREIEPESWPEEAKEISDGLDGGAGKMLLSAGERGDESVWGEIEGDRPDSEAI